MRIRDLSTRMFFGQYRGRTVQSVFQGSAELTHNFEKQLMDYAFESVSSRGERRLDQMAKTIKGDPSSYLWTLPSPKNIYEAKLQGALEEMLSVHVGYQFVQAHRGDPKYLEWAILNVKDFWLAPGALEKLNSLEVCQVPSITFSNVRFDRGQWHSKISIDNSSQKHTITSEVIARNQEKFDRAFAKP